MARRVSLRQFGIDLYTLLLLATMAVACLLPAQGEAARWVSGAAFSAVALLFFLYGARLDPAAMWNGLRNWRLQGLILALTFLAFPVLVLLGQPLLAPWLSPQLLVGLLFLAVLPSTVQSSIALTSIAGGDVPAAVCAASVSNILAVMLTPLLASLLIRSGPPIFSLSAVGGIGLQIVLPFALGQVARPLLGGFILRHRRLTMMVDRGSILLIVYSAFSAGMVAGVWSMVPASAVLLLVISAVLLAVVMLLVELAGRALSLPPAAVTAARYCGATKCLASGVPIATVLFAGQPVSLILLPIMIYHQLQLIVCAILAQRSANALQPAPLSSPVP